MAKARATKLITRTGIKTALRITMNKKTATAALNWMISHSGTESTTKRPKPSRKARLAARAKARKFKVG